MRKQHNGGQVVTFSATAEEGSRDPANSPGESDTDTHEPATSHEAATLDNLAQRLARLKGYEFAGEYSLDAEYAGPLYFVPRDTLLHSHCRLLGIASEHDFFGGSVAYPFVATKAITHPLLGSSAPKEWGARFAAAVSDVVLPGYTAFSCDEVRLAAQRLLNDGGIRLKAPCAAGGHGQYKIAHISELDKALADIDVQHLAAHGLVIEQNLAESITYSVGQVMVDNLHIAYYGTQQLTTNSDGDEVYGGSTLHLVRGDLAALAQLDLMEEIRLAVTQALCYDRATALLPGGLMASRRNYDVIQGVDDAGRPRSGVLEQSWRLGGASPAEIAALEAFRHDPALKSVMGTTVETYELITPPADAIVHFSAIDPRVGALTKYTLLQSHEY